MPPGDPPCDSMRWCERVCDWVGRRGQRRHLGARGDTVVLTENDGDASKTTVQILSNGRQWLRMTVQNDGVAHGLATSASVRTLPVGLVGLETQTTPISSQSICTRREGKGSGAGQHAGPLRPRLPPTATGRAGLGTAEPRGAIGSELDREAPWHGAARCAVRVGLGRSIALCYRSPTPCQIREHIRYLYF